MVAPTERNVVNEPAWNRPRRLADLCDGILPQACWRPYAETQVSGVCDDSRRSQPGGIFAAVVGAAADGRRFIPDAIRRGAKVVIGEGLDEFKLDAADRSGVVLLETPSTRAVLARLAARWYGVDQANATDFRLIGVTGTNGKSTTAHMTRSILHAAGLRCGMLGTVQHDLCGRSVKSEMTTPGPVELAAHIRECIDAGGAGAVMEVSSHALDQRRVDGLRFAVAGFSNLTQDHLDYHQDMETYAAAKARLFAMLDEDAIAVVNADDPYAEQMVADCRARVLRLRLQPPSGRRVDGDIVAKITRSSLAGTVYRLRVGERELVVEHGLVGRHNVYNAMLAAGLAHGCGVASDAIESGLAAVRTIPGRLQRVPGVAGVEVFVDYAHTDDALRNVAGVLRPLAHRRLIVVFGCGGDRDRGKRPLMAKAAAESAQAIIVTSDNPRTEDPQRIIDDVLTGFDDDARRRVVVEPDRAAAVSLAIQTAQPGDVVLIAGKGHEDYQIIGVERRHFDDVEVAIQAASRRGSNDALMTG